MNLSIVIIALFAIFSFECCGMKKTTTNPTAKAIIEQFNTTAYEQSLEALNTGDLAQLDPLVGDSACQIRVPLVINMYNRYQQEKEEALSEEDRKILTSCRLLTQVNNGTSTDIKKLFFNQTIPSNSQIKNYYEPFVLGHKKNLRTVSVELITKLIHELKDTELASCINHYQTSGVAQKTETLLPFYPMSKVIFKAIVASGCPIILRITHFCPQEQHLHISTITYTVKNGSLCLNDTKELDENQAAMIIEGFSSSNNDNLIASEQIQKLKDKKSIPFSPLCQNAQSQQNKLALEDIFTILLANAALHPQFIGQANKGKSIEFDQFHAPMLEAEFLAMQKKAKELGCGIEDTRMFTIRHIYAQTVGKALAQQNS